MLLYIPIVHLTSVFPHGITVTEQRISLASLLHDNPRQSPELLIDSVNTKGMILKLSHTFTTNMSQISTSQKSVRTFQTKNLKHKILEHNNGINNNGNITYKTSTSTLIRKHQL
jgi:hypothetical protein